MITSLDPTPVLVSLGTLWIPQTAVSALTLTSVCPIKAWMHVGSLSPVALTRLALTSVIVKVDMKVSKSCPQQLEDTFDIGTITVYFEKKINIIKNSLK